MRTYETPVLIKREALAAVTAQKKDDPVVVNPFISPFFNNNF